MHKLTLTFISLLVIVGSISSAKADNLSENYASIAAQIPAEAFGRLPDVTKFQLSPDGDKVVSLFDQ